LAAQAPTPAKAAAAGPTLRPPAVPLVAYDPYFSIWSPADRLTDAATVHWTGRPHPLTSIVRVDGEAFRVMGASPADTAALVQRSLTVSATRTTYEFGNEAVRVTLSFLTPSLPSDLDLLSRPVTYLTWTVASADGKPHAVQIYFECGAEIAVNTTDQRAGLDYPAVAGLSVARVGTPDQPVLARRGDDVRIDWGYGYLAAPADPPVVVSGGNGGRIRRGFLNNGAIAAPGAAIAPAPVAESRLAMTAAWDLGSVGATPSTRWAMIAYDDILSVRYFGHDLRAWWKRGGATIDSVLAAAARDRDDVSARAARFDEDLRRDLTQAGGARYAAIATLAYRQTLAATKLVADTNGQPLLFPKENFSNGCIGTVDVIYPMAPQYLLFGPTLAKALVVSNLEYASSPRWTFPFAPHDLGTYPHATGQVYGGGEKTEENQMPVEETGNMLILVAAIAQMEGHADFAGRYWPVLTRWAEYLRGKGFDPENQLCTDDFAGHLAHNVNLSAKAIVALGAFARLSEMRGDTAVAAEYRTLAEQFAARWVKEAADGDRFRLAFDRPGTWSQKYNLVWDRVLGLGLFPPAVAQKEVAHYRRIQERYGLPLDNRRLYTKLDWITWTATLTGSRADFEALVDPVFDFLNTTPHRVPMTDWYWTHDATKSGFQARSVVGGVFLRLLYDQAVWKKWSAPAPASLRDRIQAYLDEWRAASSFQGASVGVVLADGTAFGVVTGVADRAVGTPLKVDDLFLAGSTGKTFFAAVALQLIEQGRLELDAPISKYLGTRPWFSRLPNAKDVTVRHLMTHTSGIVRYEMDSKFTAALRAQPDRAWSPEEEVAFQLDATPPFPAGKGWEYSDTNYVVLGMIVEGITGTRLYDEIARRFLKPLALARVVPSTGRRIPGLVPGYAGPRDPLGLPDEMMVKGELVINPQFEWAGGGFATSPLDLARWGRELYAGRALSPQARRIMLDAAVPARLGPETKYGLGVIVRSATPVGTTWGHSGFFPGYQTELLYVPDLGVSLAVQVNTSAPRSTGGRSLARVLYDIAGMTKPRI
jgi:CubicO group peptidase (beta-lactamase class C family)